MMMTCGRARRLLWPDTGPRKATAEVEQAQEHVSRCQLCRRFLEDMRVMAERIRVGAARPEAPVEVRDRLFKALARARTASPPPRRTSLIRRIVIGLAVGALVAGAWVSLGLLRDRATGARDPFSALAEEHMRTVRNFGVMSSDSLHVAEWLADRLPFGVEVPIFPDAQLKGARLFLVNQRSGAVIEYSLRGHSLSYYVFPAEAGASAGRDVRVASRDGYRVAVWEEPGVGHALVTDLPTAEILALARYCMRQMLAEVAAGLSMAHG
jgi:anti-sigma factor RsiW